MILDEKNKIDTWQQSYFADDAIYNKWTQSQKDRADFDESFKVKSHPLNNAVCVCYNPDDAKWIAERLNLASKLERLFTAK